MMIIVNRYLILLTWMLLGHMAYGQSKKISIPDIPGYQTLKGDFHMHTVFSDGHVWPTFRAVNGSVS